LIQYLNGVELLFHQKGRSASFGSKMALSLNGVDLGYMNSITGSTCRAKCSNILHDISKIVITVGVPYQRKADCKRYDIREDNAPLWVE
jgi:hypothetical protein